MTRHECTIDCERMPECSMCRKIKKPYGRSVPIEATNGYCDYECPGYRVEPRAGHLWPGELAEYRAAESKE